MAEPEIIDGGTFAKLFDSLGADVDFLGELVDAYFDSTPGLFASMHQAIAAGDAAGLQRAAHSLKTGSANFGALAFATLCKQLEDLGKAGALDGTEEKIGALEAAYGEVVAALRARVDSARRAVA